MIVGVTGTRGYLGGALVELLLQRGHEVVAFTRSPAISIDPQLRFGPFELGSTVDERYFHEMDAVVHCAFDFRDVGSPDFEKRNVEGSVRFFTQAHNAGVSRLLFVSSMAAYPDCRSVYGRSKYAVETVTRNLGGISVRPGTIFSAESGGLFAALERLVTLLPVIPVIGNRRLKLHLVHLDDLCVALASIVERHSTKPMQEPITLAHPHPVSFRDLLEEIARSRTLRRVFLPVPASVACGALRNLERIGLGIGLNSDSLVSLMWPNPTPHFNSEFALRSFPE